MVRLIDFPTISAALQDTGGQLGYGHKGFKFKFIWNILKVIVMSQKIMGLENKVGSLENDLVKKDRIITEERLKAQGERRKAQREIEALRKQLIKLGVEPDRIEQSE